MPISHCWHIFQIFQLEINDKRDEINVNSVRNPHIKVFIKVAHPPPTIQLETPFIELKYLHFIKKIHTKSQVQMRAE